MKNDFIIFYYISKAINVTKCAIIKKNEILLLFIFYLIIDLHNYIFDIFLPIINGSFLEYPEVEWKEKNYFSNYV